VRKTIPASVVGKNGRGRRAERPFDVARGVITTHAALSQLRIVASGFVKPRCGLGPKKKSVGTAQRHASSAAAAYWQCSYEPLAELGRFRSNDHRPIKKTIEQFPNLFAFDLLRLVREAS